MMNASLPSPVMIVEDDPEMMRRTTRLLHEIGYKADQIQQAPTVQQALKSKQKPIALALIDLGLPDGNGVEVIQAYRENDPNMLIMVISGWSTREAILSALRAGANGYLLKERDDLELSISIRSVISGGAPIDPFLARKIIDALPSDSTPEAQASPEATLTSRQHEILHLVADGMSNREIAEHLFISKYTVECHIKNIYQKLSASNRINAVSVARSLGLLP
ncbi:response regulator transcription factor [Cardiobacteriaceae bacterium TAE3-ERU3]|nr:response regulator transcription factor [Cardiobacteriaceae bacterium TAE3-ERU3]